MSLEEFWRGNGRHTRDGNQKDPSGHPDMRHVTTLAAGDTGPRLKLARWTSWKLTGARKLGSRPLFGRASVQVVTQAETELVGVDVLDHGIIGDLDHATAEVTRDRTGRRVAQVEVAVADIEQQPAVG